MSEIKLPPLPDDLIAQRMTETEVRSLLKRYGEQCAIAAIEADRQQREKDLQLCEEALEVEIQHSRRLQKELDGLRADRQRSAAELAPIYEMFHIGTAAREPHILRQNIENVKRRADCLGAVEHEFFMVPGEPDEDYPDDEPADECLLRWGAEPESYVEQFRTALDRIRPAVISDRKRRGEPFKSRRIDDVVRSLQASVAVGSDGEWVSIRREARDAAINRLQELNSDCAHMYESCVELASRSAPQPPQIPDPHPLRETMSSNHRSYAEGWNACRAAMLKAAPEVKA